LTPEQLRQQEQLAEEIATTLVAGDRMKEIEALARSLQEEP
jgi:hypothetical protein